MHRRTAIVVTFLLVAVVAAAMTGLFGRIIGSSEALHAPPKRVVFITIDTLRADHLATYGYRRDAAPFLSSLAAKGLVFMRAYSASSHTAPSHTSMFTSLYPAQHNVLRNHETLSDTVFSMAGMAKELGFETVAFPATHFLDGKVGFPLLAAEDDLPADPDARTGWFRRAQKQGNRVIHWLDSSRKTDRFFMWLHFYDVHQWEHDEAQSKKHHRRFDSENFDEQLRYLVDDHKIPRDFFGTEKKLVHAINGYDARLSTVDEQIARIAEHFEKLGLADDLLWVITSDHGEGLGNHRYAGHGENLYDEQLHIPLIMARNRAVPTAPRRVEFLMRSIDIFPTLAELFGFALTERSPGIRGRSVFPALSNPSWRPPDEAVAFAQRRPRDMESHRRTWSDGEVFALISEYDKLIDRSEGAPELFDLATDPHELDNRAEKDPAKRDAVREKLRAVVESFAGQAKDTGEMDSSAEALEELKALGYL